MGGVRPNAALDRAPVGQLRRSPQAAGPGGQVENVLKFLDMAEETESGLVDWRVERKEE